MQQSVLGVLRSWTPSLRPPAVRMTRRQVAGDVLLWVVLAVTVAALNGAPTPVVLEPGRAVVIVLELLLLGVTVALGRPYPHVALLLAVVPVLLGVGQFSLVMMVMSYLAGRRLAHVQPVLVAYGLSLVIGYLLGLGDGLPVRWINLGSALDNWANNLMGVVFFSVFPWLAGRSWRQYQELVRAGWERAELLEREQRMLVSQARLRERTRIAHDMHDSLGHELSLIALRAGALEVDPGLDEARRDAAGELRANASAAAARLREVIGVLRDDTDPAPLEPAGDSVAALVERAASAGMAVTLEREGEQGELAPMVDRAAYRVVQEGLTNAAKHAPGAPVTVRLVGGADATVVQVTSGPPVTGLPPEPAAGGHGLVGLRERVRLAGGTFHAELTERGGFEVVARMPLDPADVPADVAGAERAGADLESTHQRQHVERRVRRSLIAAIAVPAAISAGLALVIGGLFVFQTLNSVLEPEEYAQLRVGQQRGTVASLLPSQQYLERPENMVEPPVPPGATCEYYRSSSNVLVDAGVYRLCFTGGRLMAKDLLSPSGTGTTP